MVVKDKINLVSVVTIWRCPCVELSLVLVEKGVYYDQCILLTKLCWPLPWFILCSKAKLACYSRYLLTSYFCIPIFYNEMTFVCVCVCVLVLEGVVDIHKTDQLYLLLHQWFWHRLELLWCQLVYLRNELRSFCCFWVCMQVLHFWILL